MDPYGHKPLPAIGRLLVSVKTRLPAHLNSSTARHRSAHCRRTGSLSAPAACRHTPVFFSKYSIDHLIRLSFKNVLHTIPHLPEEINFLLEFLIKIHIYKISRDIPSYSRPGIWHPAIFMISSFSFLPVHYRRSVFSSKDVPAASSVAGCTASLPLSCTSSFAVSF